MTIPQSRLPHRHSSTTAILHASLDNHNNHSRLPHHQQKQQMQQQEKQQQKLLTMSASTDMQLIKRKTV